MEIWKQCTLAKCLWWKRSQRAKGVLIPCPHLWSKVNSYRTSRIPQFTLTWHHKNIVLIYRNTGSLTLTFLVVSLRTGPWVIILGSKEVLKREAVTIKDIWQTLMSTVRIACPDEHLESTWFWRSIRGSSTSKVNWILAILWNIWSPPQAEELLLFYLLKIAKAFSLIPIVPCTTSMDFILDSLVATVVKPISQLLSLMLQGLKWHYVN